MGECLKTRRDGNMYSLPTLNTAYPQDVSIIESASGNATFQVAILIDGKPAEYTYQWYVNNSAVSGATSSTYTKTGLTSTGTYSVYCNVTNKAGTVKSRVATLSVKSSKPTYTYSGNSTLIDDGNYNWRIKFTTSGTLQFSHLGNVSGGIQVFCVGGGGGPESSYSHYNSNMGGAGGGYTNTVTVTSVSTNTNYTVIVGAGGTKWNQGGSSSAFGVSANGGKPPYGAIGGDGGSGGGGSGQVWEDNDRGGYGGKGGSDGGNGQAGYWFLYGNNYAGGKGQGTTTREFGESSGTLYSGGGGGSGYEGAGAAGSGGGGAGGQSGGNGSWGTSGTVNTGGGAGSRIPNNNITGGSGIVVIRNKR